MTAILSKPNENNHLRPVCYFSRNFSPTEASWQVHNQEIGTIIEAFKEWKAWLIGAKLPIRVFSDHANIRYFMTSVTLSSRQTRWASFLSEFHFIIAHTPADPQSFQPDYSHQKIESTPPQPLLMYRDSYNPLALSPICLAPITEVSKNIFSSYPFFITLSVVQIERLHHLCQHFDPDNKSVLHDNYGFLWHCGRLCVPPNGRCLLFEVFHSDPMAGHQGLARTLSTLLQTFSWPGICEEL
ncbi:hypothetical protein O181_010752 [Austropuccinia psidii MF-1]|uniref:Reverse transcriptase RNase H-like domain-containing protein n=1 Tax=Austropuccinia psidii MF-1 TaxID=1389203 RepID=A0A9Q3BT98_9BASI|nr:hypothetical protein [Austropuccinia psidii MF-1]